MLSNTAVPKYYGEFREKVIRGEIPVNHEVSLEMNRIDDLIDDPEYYYDPAPVEGWIAFCESELTLTDGSDFVMLFTFKVWGEQVFGWYEFIEREVYVPYANRPGGRYKHKRIRRRLIQRQYLIVGRGAAKSLYDTCIQAYFHVMDASTTDQVTAAPTMKQAEEVISPYTTAITRARGPLFGFLTEGTTKNTTGSKASQPKLASTKEGIKNYLTNSLLEIKPMSIAKLQGSRARIATVDEWLSGDIKEDVMSALQQSASKNDDYLIIATSSEGTSRNGPGDTIKMELTKILKGEYYEPHVSIWWYKLDDVSEVGDPSMWPKANPNIGKTVTYETYQQDVERAENAPSNRNDILAKRFGIPMEGYTYYFTYEETIAHRRANFNGMPCSMGADLSKGDDFCAFTFLFPLYSDAFGVKALSFITEYTYSKLPAAMKRKYDEFIAEGTLTVMPGTVLDMELVYDEVDQHIMDHDYDVRSFGYDPYNAKTFVERWERENSPYGVTKVIQGMKTESVPLGELKKYAEKRALHFDQLIMEFSMGNCIVLQDTNGNKKLYKQRLDEKIDNVAAMMDAYVAYKAFPDAFE